MFRRAPSTTEQNASTTNKVEDAQATETQKVTTGDKKMDNNNQDITEAKKPALPTQSESQFAQPRKNLEIPSAAARRPMMPSSLQQTMPQQPQGLQMMQSTMGGFNAPSSSNIGHNSQNATADSKRLVIGEGISISGDIGSCDYLIVEGSVKSDFKGSNRIDISKSGDFTGSIETKEADIAGTFEGTLIVNGRLTIRSSGKITGTVYYKELAVDSGAVIDGKINAIDENSTKTLSKASSALAVDKKKKGTNNTPSSKKSDALNQQSLLATG